MSDRLDDFQDILDMVSKATFGYIVEIIEVEDMGELAIAYVPKTSTDNEFVAVQPKKIREEFKTLLKNYTDITQFYIYLSAHELRHKYQKDNPTLKLVKLGDFAFEDEGVNPDDPFEEDAHVIGRVCELLWEMAQESQLKRIAFAIKLQFKNMSD